MTVTVVPTRMRWDVLVKSQHMFLMAWMRKVIEDTGLTFYHIKGTVERWKGGIRVVEILKASHLPASMEERSALNIVLLVTRPQDTESKAEAKTQDLHQPGCQPCGHPTTSILTSQEDEPPPSPDSQGTPGSFALCTGILVVSG